VGNLAVAGCPDNKSMARADVERKEQGQTREKRGKWLHAFLVTLPSAMATDCHEMDVLLREYYQRWAQVMPIFSH